MNLPHPVVKYRTILIASLLVSGSLLPLLPALADRDSPTPGTLIENQATAAFTDATDTTNTPQNIVSDKVKVTVAEVAGISASNAGITASGGAYRTNVVYFDFLVKNEGNDPTQLFIPAAPSSATIGGVALPANSIGQLQVIEYNNVTATTPITTNNLVSTTTGAATGSLSGVPNGGSVPAGGYIKVRVPITVPFGANIGDIISVTLGNTSGQPANTNTPYVIGANGAVGTGNDLYTKDNPDATDGSPGAPVNGEQEASSTQTVPVTAPPNINIGGTVWDDANGSGTSTFGGIQTGTEIGAKVTPALNAILVNSAGNVVATTLVDTTTGTYLFNVPGVQKGLYVILSTSAGVVNSPAPTPSLPAVWTNTSPLTYVALPFDIGIANVVAKDFGIDRLPVTQPVNTPSQPNPPGLTKYQVPILTAIDGEDGNLGGLGTSTFKIVTIPTPAQGILYYNNVAVKAGDPIDNYDPTKLTFDPVDGVVTMSFTYAAIDAAGKQDPNPATATMAFAATPVTISGTVWNDKDNSAKNTFINIQTGTEAGTDAVFGTTITPVNAILVDAMTGFVLQTKVVGADGIYSFGNVAPSTDVKVIISPTAGSIGSTPPTAASPTGWLSTSPAFNTFNSGLLPITQDFGIRQKAKFVLVKRITKINGLTTNPNDGTNLTGSTLDTFNNVDNWPANYLVGKTNAGLVKPNDTIEYTVYFLNNQGADATNVKICDPIRGTQDYVPNSILLNISGTNNSATDVSLTDITDPTTDRANFYLANSAPTDCNAGAASSTDPGVAISITGADSAKQPAQTAVPGAIGVGTPTTSYGLFRFTTKVKP